LCGIVLWRVAPFVGLMFVVLLRVFIYEGCFFFCLDAKETKNIHGLLLFFGIHESSISSLNIFTPKIIRRIYLTYSLLLLVFDEPHFVSVSPIATPAARAAHSTPGSLPAANAQILAVIFWCGNYKGDERTLFYLYYCY
jgi:hypothetical protein